MEHVRGLVDSTLREGSQTVGVAFSLEQKVAIARHLVRIGVEEVSSRKKSATPEAEGWREKVCWRAQWKKENLGAV